MRALPDNPSADFLRKEAKDLLAALRESDPATTLSTAQRRLADHYGFRGWPELVAAVDKSRAAVPQASHELTEELSEAFGLGRPTQPMTAVIYEYMGRRWSINTDRGRFIAGPVFDWITEAQAELAVSLMERARQAGIAAPEAVRASDESLVKKVAGESWRVDRWMDYGPAPMPPVRAKVSAGVGEILATLHGLAIPAEGPVTPFLTYRRPLSDWEELVERGESERRAWTDDLKALLPTVAALRDVPIGEPDQLILCHSNITLENVRLGPGDALVVLNWEFAGPLSRNWELGSVVWHWGMHPETHLPAAKALMDSYAHVSGSRPDLDLDTFSVAITGWLNWTYNQFCESASPADPDAEAFAKREIRDLVEHPLTVSKLEQVLSELNG